MAMYQQFDLRSHDTQITCWLLAEDPRFRRGVLLMLKNDPVGRWWEIVRIHPTAVPSTQELQRDEPVTHSA